MSTVHWSRGDTVIWRSRPFGTVGYVTPHIVVEDTEEVVALFQPAGSLCKRRNGRRGGPRGRSLVEWDGTHADVVFKGPANVRVHKAGTSHAVHRFWDADRGVFTGWYVNLESPWTRTPLGFDSWDQILDIEVTDDLGLWRWKDVDELEWYVDEGWISQSEADAIRSGGERAVDRLESRAWPSSEDWMRWRPEEHWPIPRIPPGWSSP